MNDGDITGLFLERGPTSFNDLSVCLRQHDDDLGSRYLSEIMKVRLDSSNVMRMITCSY